VSLRIRSQLLFAEQSDRSLTIDGALMTPAGELPSGSPVTLVLRLPASGVVAAVVSAAVGRWADAADVVDLELRRRDEMLRAVLTDGMTTIRLDVETAGTLAA
jgi:hypothetical protein